MEGAESKGKVEVAIEPWDACIPDLACNVVCPEVFMFDRAQGKAIINPEYNIGPPWKGIVDRELRKCVEIAAKACPLGIIKVKPAD